MPHLRAPKYLRGKTGPDTALRRRTTSGARHQRGHGAGGPGSGREKVLRQPCLEPFFFQGTKTFAFEVSEQLGWKPPDTVILPVGNGTLLLGAYIGFRELLQAGVIDRMPRIIGVQAENCAPLYRAYQQNRAEVPPVENRETLAEGIAIARPVRGRQILDAIRQTKGQILAVSEDEIGKALGEICRQGYYIEPTSAATIAGIKEYLPGSSPGEVIVSVFTGHGLKATEKMLKLLP